MSSDYILTLEAIDRRLYSKDKSRPLARFSASDLSLPKGNHTGDGLSDECLTYMTDLLTKHGRPNLQVKHFLCLHFGRSQEVGLRRITTQPQSFSSGFQGLGSGGYQQAFAEVINDALLATMEIQKIRT